MSLQNTCILNLDTHKSIANISPSFIANDTAVLVINLFENGIPYDLSSVDRCTLSFQRPDKVVVTGLATISGNVITYKMGSTEMEKEGSIQAIVQIYSGEDRISSKPFKIKITKDWESGIGSETEKTLLMELFTETKTNSDFALAQGNFAKSQGENLGHKGNYNSALAYKNNNVVTFNGLNFIATQDVPINTDPTNGAYWTSLSPQSRFNSKTWTATEGQTVFTIDNGSYVPNSNQIVEFVVGGVPQRSGEGFTETSSTSFTLAEGVPVNTVIFAKWVEGAFSISKTHKSSHEVGGQDELDVTKLKNIDKFPKTVVSATSPTDGSLFWIDTSVQ